MCRAILLNDFKENLSEHNPGTGNLESLNEQTDLADDPEIESPDIANIATGIENKYNIEVGNDSARRMNTIGRCKNIKQEKLCSRCRLCKAV